MPDQAFLALDFVDRLARESAAVDVARGVCRLFAALGHVAIVELPLDSGHRADVVGLDGAGRFAIVEIKTSADDLRNDRKWPAYLDHCDHFYFAVPLGFPLDLLPPEHGLIVADRFGGEILRAAMLAVLAPARRRRMTLRFARAAAARLRRFEDPPV
jgi:hypothetical protein